MNRRIEAIASAIGVILWAVAVLLTVVHYIAADGPKALQKALIKPRTDEPSAANRRATSYTKGSLRVRQPHG
jgi:hypothetical protein